jgi:cytochrome c oxidase assembly protein subunit 11
MLFRHRKIVLWGVAATLLMFAFGFALVPLYNAFCQITGLNGKTSNMAAVANDAPIDATRSITVEFVANIAANLPWQFYPVVKKITLHPGENKRVAFFAENNSPNTMTVRAVPSVSPGVAAQYLRKTECFCFTEQTLAAGKALDMPLIFHIDRGIPTSIKLLTLSYTLYDARNLNPVAAEKKGRL